MMSCTTCAYFGSPRESVSRCKTNSRSAVTTAVVGPIVVIDNFPLLIGGVSVSFGVADYTLETIKSNPKRLTRL